MHYTKKRLLIGALSIFLAAGSLCAAPVQAEETAQQPAVEDQTDVDAPDQDKDADQDKDNKKTKKEKREEKLASWLKVCDKMGQNMNKKRFRHSYSAGSRSYKRALHHGKRVNCSMFVSWCLQEYGALKEGQTFYCRHNRIRKNFRKFDSKKVKVKRVMRRCRSVKLHPGDVVCFAGKPHAAIYAGLSSKGHRTWYDAGRHNTYRGCQGSRFKRIKPETNGYLSGRKIAYIIRIKGL